MDPFFIKAIQLLLSLSLLIVLHELGHFIPAKLFKTRVEKFYLFFDLKFSLFKKKIGDTVYGIGWLPLGGYVKISGMIDESMDKEQMAKPPQPWEFRSKPAWQRLIIMLGGVTVNIILGFAIYMMVLFVWGEKYVSPESLKEGFTVSPIMQDLGFEDGDQIVEVNGKDFENPIDINRHLLLRDVQEITVNRDGNYKSISLPEDIGMQLFTSGEVETSFYPIIKPQIDSVDVDSPAEKAGLLKGDKIVALNGKEILNRVDFSERMKENGTKPVVVQVSRDGITKDFEITPNDEGLIGVIHGGHFDIETKTYGFAESISAGFDYGYWTLKDYATQFKYVFTQEGATQVGGFGAIGSLFPSGWDWQGFWMATALISIILAFMNILPIPALDGGHVMFLLYEMISGRKPNEKVMEYAQVIGFFIIIALVLFANGNDVYRWLFE
ncbi:RIP metalloprotease RseP [Psychroflexus planctonicus]|uniref:Zinc metalloprotease n=1 Tax=Psychroflexus planctonicus TaxID=1526575 RepID=A0ABQ1SFM4_9FLAO|nr:RIP metalloprotease RseP [Psychroflexus planctonicus]GGE34399.1 zinc metalloprotease [Psychroflexus planctonicus]